MAILRNYQVFRFSGANFWLALAVVIKRKRGRQIDVSISLAIARNSDFIVVQNTIHRKRGVVSRITRKSPTGAANHCDLQDFAVNSLASIVLL
jgi:hypothetical protein